MQQMLSPELLAGATFPFQAFRTHIDIDEEGKVLVAKIDPITVLQYNLAEGASIKTIVAKSSDRALFRSSCESYHATPESAQEEIDEALAYAADNPPYKVLKQQRDEARALLKQMAEELRDLGYADANARASSSDAVSFLCQHFDAINAFLPPEERE